MASLGVDTVRLKDNFFQLGGDSIKIISVVSKLRKAFSCDIDIADVYEAENLAELALLINDRLGSNNQKDDTLYRGILDELDGLRERILNKLGDDPNIEDILPLSTIQSGMIFSSLIEQKNAVYHDQVVYSLRPDLDSSRLRSALLLLTEKHPALRTSFNLCDFDQPVQLIYRNVDIKLSYFDIDTTSAFGEIITDYVSSQRARPFEMDKAPLWRAAVFKTLDRSIFIFEFHHAIIDGWSLANFETELTNTYKALELSEGIQQLAKLKCSIRDCIVEHRIEGGDEAGKRFWKDEMDGYFRPNLFVETYELKTYSANLDQVVQERLRDLATEDDIFIKTIFLGAFVYTLGMLTGEDEVTIGLVTNTRPVKEDGDKVMGCFLNTIPLRYGIDKNNLTWADFFRGLQNKLTALKKYERVALVNIVKATGEEFNGQNPFSDVLFNFTNYFIHREIEETLIVENNIDVDLKILDYAVTNTLLDFDVNVTSRGINVYYLCRKSLRCGKTLPELHAYIMSVIDCYLERRNELVDNKQIISVREQGLMQSRSGTTIRDRGLHKSIVDHFVMQSRIHSTGIALAHGDVSITYEELSLKSNQLASFLINLGISKGSILPICMENSADIIIAILGIWKAGAAYVPIDIKSPVDRISLILEDIQARLLLTTSKSIKFLSVDWNVKIVAIDSFYDHNSFSDLAVQRPMVSGSDLAYVIYTSGTTGTPVGVMVEHESLYEMVMIWRSEYELQEAGTVVLSLSNYAFDVFTGDVCRALVGGGKLVLIEEQNKFDFQHVCDVIMAHGVTFLESVPSVITGLFDFAYHRQINMRSFKTIVFGSDTVTKNDYERLCQHLGNSVRIINSYGLTETTIDASYFEGPCGQHNSVPIGKPIGESKFQILDKWGQLAPVGVIGELHISGTTISRGYLNRPELTNTRFNSKTLKRFKTRDYARWLHDGNIEFFGRADEQIKIHGIRIESSEIENVLRKISFVKQAVALVISHHGRRQLVAYVETESEFEVEPALAFLKKHLPMYMIPRHLLTIDRMPLTRNGKIDRDQLRKLGRNIEMPAMTFTMPQTATEVQVSEIWKELLHLDKVSVCANLGELGGDSITIIQIFNRLKAINDRLSISDLMECQSISQQAELLSRTVGGLQVKNKHLLLLSNKSQSSNIFVAPGVVGISEGYCDLSDAFSRAGMIYGFQMMGLLDGETTYSSISEIAKKNLEWVRLVQPQGPYRFIGHSLGGHVVFEMIRQLEDIGESVNVAIIIDVGTSLSCSIPDEIDYALPIVIDLAKSLIKSIDRISENRYREFKSSLKSDPASSTIDKMIDFVIAHCGNEQDLGVKRRLLKLNIQNRMLSNQISGCISSPVFLVRAKETDWHACDQSLGWNNHIENLTVLTCPGDHNSVIRAPNIGIVFDELRKYDFFNVKF